MAQRCANDAAASSGSSSTVEEHKVNLLQYFDKITVNGDKFSQCKLCSRQLATWNSQSNQRVHLLSFHKSALAPEDREALVAKRRRLNSTVSTGQQVLTAFRPASLTSPRGYKCARLVMRLLASCKLPLTFFQNPAGGSRPGLSCKNQSLITRDTAICDMTLPATPHFAIWGKTRIAGFPGRRPPLQSNRVCSFNFTHTITSHPAASQAQH